MPYQPATRTTGAARWLTQEEKMIWGAEGRCFWCGELGHSARGCPEAPAPRPTPVVRPGRPFGGRAVTPPTDIWTWGSGDPSKKGGENRENAEKA